MTGDFKILCFDDATGMPMDIPTIVDYKYEVILPTHQMAQDAFNVFTADVDEFLDEDTSLLEEKYIFSEKWFEDISTMYFASFRILLSSYPTDYIVATGTSHSLRQLVDYACSYYGLNPETCITTSKKSYRLSDISTSLLSPDKIIRELGWHPTTTFPLLIEKLAKKV